MHYLGYFFAIIIGVVMGLIGGGGSILSVPVFAYIFRISALEATTLSLFVVGVTSVVGSIAFVRERVVDFRTVAYFGLPSIAGILFSRRVVLPHLPPYIIHRWGITLSKDMFILTLFGILMLISATKMIRKSSSLRPVQERKGNQTLLISQGLLVGIVTGFIGAGGGFLIVPALVMLLGLTMRQAVGTSLVIISINSLIGFVSSLDKISINWPFLLIFTGLSILGIIFGSSISRKIDGAKLKPMFGWFVLVMGVWIIVKELFLKNI